MGVWDDLGPRLGIDTGAGLEAKPEPQDLDRYEAGAGFRLPEDYRGFVLAIGPGRLGRRGWGFFTPGPSHEGGRTADLAGINRWFRDPDGGGHPGCRHVLFCDLEDYGAHFGWDPEDLTDPATHEYGVYLLKEEPPVKVASTFREFVTSYVLGGGFERHWFHEAGRPGEWEGADPIPFRRGRTPTAAAWVEPAVYRLARPPQRFGPQGENVLWMEVRPDGRAEAKVWVPRGGPDRERMERFWRACQDIDWEQSEVHEIRP